MDRAARSLVCRTRTDGDLGLAVLTPTERRAVRARHHCIQPLVGPGGHLRRGGDVRRRRLGDRRRRAAATWPGLPAVLVQHPSPLRHPRDGLDVAAPGLRPLPGERTSQAAAAAVPCARPRSGFTRDFEDLVAFLATKTDKTTITRISRVDWDTVGRICERVVADGLDPERLDGLVNIGVDEVSWRRHHQYLTLVADHDTKKIVWGAPGKDTATLDAFFDDLGPDRAARLEAVSMDMGAAFNKSVRAEGHAPQAMICIDPFHAVQLVTDALDVVRRLAWNELRQLPDQGAAKRFKGARWALLKRPANLTRDPAQAASPRRGRLAGLQPQGILPRHLRRRPGRRRRRDAARPVVLQSLTFPPALLRQGHQDHPQAPRRQPGRHRARGEQRQGRGTEQPRPPDHPPRLRLPLRPGSPGPGDALLRTNHRAPTPRTRARMIHTHAGRAAFVTPCTGTSGCTSCTAASDG